MAQTAGLTKGSGPPAELGQYTLQSSAVGFSYVFSGTTYYAVIRSGPLGWVIVGGPSTVPETAVNAAFTALGAGARITLLNGTWPLGPASISFTTFQQVLEGQGRGTFIDATAAAAGRHGIALNGFDDCIVRNLSINSKGATGAASCIFIQNSAHRFLIENVIIINSDDDGIHVEGITLDTGRILNCIVLGVDGNGIHVNMDAGNFIYRLHIEGCDITGCGITGIYFVASGGNHYCEIINNTLYSNTNNGIVLTDGDYTQVRGNICLLNGQNGIYLISTLHNQVLGNILYQNGRHGILLADADYCTVENNTCVENDSGDSATYDGINIDASSTWNDLLGNVCVGNHRFGIYVLGLGNSANSNVCAENDQHGIVVNVGNCKVNDNLCYHNGADADNTYNGIALFAGADRCTANGNTCYGDGVRQRHGISLSDGAIDCPINDNICYNNTADGIHLTANNDNCTLMGNRCLGNGGWGINNVAATSNNCIILGNNLEGNTTGALQDNAPDTTSALNSCGGNVYNSKGCGFATVQEAITHLAGDGWVEVPVGTHAEALTIANSNVTLRGLGRGSLIQPGAAAGHGITISGNHDHVTIRNLAIDTKTNVSVGNGIFIEDGADWFVIEYVTIVDSDLDGIHIEGTTIDTGRILHCIILGADARGIMVIMDGANFIYRLHIEGCDITGCAFQGIQLTTSGGNLYCEVINNVVYSCGRDGVYLADGDYSQVRGNICLLNSGDGIEIESSTYVQVVGNTCYQNENHGIFLDDADYCGVENNTCVENDSGDTATYDGIHVDVDSTWNDVLGNICVKNHRHGIYVWGDGTNCNSNVLAENDQDGIQGTTARDSKINDNLCYHNGADSDNAYSGIDMYDCDRCTVNGNTCYSDGVRQKHGIILAAFSTDCSINGNICYLNVTDGIHLFANNDDCTLTENHCLSNGAYGININNVNCLNNRVKDNILRNNGTAPMRNLGTDTEFETIELYCLTYSNNTNIEDGIEIDEAAEWASFIGQMPLEVQQTMHFEIWGVGLAAPGGGNQMMLEIETEGAAEDEPLATHDSGPQATVGDTTNFLIGDIVKWTFTHAAALALLGGDSVKFVARHNVAVGGDIATDVALRRVLAHIV